MLANTSPETEYHLYVRRTTNGDHTDIYWAHKELSEVQCLEMHPFLQYTLRLKMYVLFYCHLELDMLD
jgi:hypothetical protein